MHSAVRHGSLQLSTKHPVNSAASKRLAVSTGAERSGRPIVEIRAHVMVRIGRRSYFAAPQRRAGIHVLMPPRLRSGGESPSRSANRRRRTMRKDDGGTRAEERCVDRIENRFATQGLRRIRFIVAVVIAVLDIAGFPRGTLGDRRADVVLVRPEEERHAIAEISGLQIGRCSLHEGCERNICILGLKALSVCTTGKKQRSGFFGSPFRHLLNCTLKVTALYLI